MSKRYIFVTAVGCLMFVWSYTMVAAGSPFDALLLALASMLILFQAKEIEELRR